MLKMIMFQYIDALRRYVTEKFNNDCCSHGAGSQGKPFPSETSHLLETYYGI
jgi:hypothetical protein